MLLRRGCVVFGQVTDGMDVIDKIEAVAARPHEVAARHFTSDASEVEARMAIDPHAGIPGIHGRPLPPPIDFGKAPSMATEARAAVEATADRQTDRQADRQTDR